LALVRQQVISTLEHCRKSGLYSKLPFVCSKFMTAKVILTITQGINPGKEYVCDTRETYIMGRHEECNLSLPNDENHITISRYHCLLDVNPPDICIRDFGSMNGTFVNDHKIGQRPEGQTPEEGQQIKFPEYDLKTGDTIKLGQTIFTVSTVAATTASFVQPVQPGFNILAAIQGLLAKAAGNADLRGIKDYQIIRELGRGGCGAVYLAQGNSGKTVALKVMLPQAAASEHAVRMFLREMANTKALKHPNVVELLDYGEADGIFFFTMEYCSDDSVAALMKKQGGKLAVEVAMPLILQVLDGLAYTHQAPIPYVKLADGSIGSGKGLVHRDLKPANIFLQRVNNKLVAKIGDYGLAKAFELSGLSGQTLTGKRGAMGTSAFMSRQQLLNCKYSQPEVDVWAAAACLYNMLTGDYPRNLAGQDPFAAVLNNPVVPIRQRDSQIPVKLAAAIDLALQEQPQIHFQNALDFKAALQKAIS
jgi:eukaryotic-like serine/threonine-protein kinase